MPKLEEGCRKAKLGVWLAQQKKKKIIIKKNNILLKKKKKKKGPKEEDKKSDFLYYFYIIYYTKWELQTWSRPYTTPHKSKLTDRYKIFNFSINFVPPPHPFVFVCVKFTQLWTKQLEQHLKPLIFWHFYSQSFLIIVFTPNKGKEK